MNKKIDKLLDMVIPYLRARDWLYVIFFMLFLSFVCGQLQQLAPGLVSPVGWGYTLLFLLIMVIIYSARWYKVKTGESLYAELLSPDREGSLRQLIHRARTIHADSDRNKSKGWNTTFDGDGIVLGKNNDNETIASPSDSEEHVLVIGGSGSGKTSAVLIPTAQRFNGGIYAIDISGDIYSKCKCKRNIALLDPHSPNSVAFNVFAEVDTAKDKSEKIILLKKLANLIIPEFEPKKTGDGVYFQQGAHLLFYASLIYYYSKGLDFCELCFEIINKSSKELVSLIKCKDSPPNAKMTIKAFDGLREANLASMKQTLDSYISVFATSRPIKRILHRNNGSEQQVISAKELETRDIFLCIPQREIVFFSPLMRLISGIILDYCSNRLLYNERELLICLDEFSSLGFLDILNPLATLRKHSTRILVATQSLADIDNIYGITNRKVILDNCRIKIILGAGDRDTQEYFSRLIGTHEVIKKTRTYTDGQAQHTYSTIDRPIIAPEELGYLRDDCIVLLPDGYMKLRKAYFFEGKF